MKIPFILLVITTIGNAQNRDDYFAYGSIHTLISALNKAFDYALTYYDRINLDCYFGIIRCQALLEEASLTTENTYLKRSIHGILVKIYTLEDLLGRITENQKDWVAYVADPSIWRTSIEYKYNQLEPKKKEAYTNYDSMFNETLSDFCFEDLINTTFSMSEKHCNIDKDCFHSFIKNVNYGSGYVATHKLLYLQLAKARNCQLDEYMLNVQVRNLCSNILGEIMFSESPSHNNQQFDLKLEQMFVCGYEGYVDFLNSRWLKFILEAQQSEGCFPVFYGSHLDDLLSKLPKLQKRDTNIWIDGCSDHTTGLATAMLGLYLNYFLQIDVADLKTAVN